MNQEKLKYAELQIRIMRFETEDIIATSPNNNDVPEKSGIDLPIDPFTP